MKFRVGVYICSCGTNISDNIDIDELVRFSSSIDNVGYVKVNKLLCSEDGKNYLAEDIIKEKPDRVVIAACTPKEHEKTFRNVLLKAGLNPYLFQMVNIREQVAWVTSGKADATEKAKSYIRAAVRRVAFHEPLEKKEIDCNTDVLVIGAGPAGMEAALVLAKAGRKVCLVERNSFIGGRVARYEEVFPKMECGSCMLEPKMDEILHNENIELLTRSELKEVLGFLGNFVVRIEKKAAFVDREKCIGCGACYEECPVTVRNESDYNLSDRKAIHVPYTGALPNVPVIDMKACLRFEGQLNTYKEALEKGLITKEEFEKFKNHNDRTIVAAYALLQTSILTFAVSCSRTSRRPSGRNVMPTGCESVSAMSWSVSPVGNWACARAGLESATPSAAASSAPAEATPMRAATGRGLTRWSDPPEESGSGVRARGEGDSTTDPLPRK